MLYDRPRECRIMELEQVAQTRRPAEEPRVHAPTSTSALLELLEAVEAREVLERSLARLAADRRTETDLEQLGRAVEGMRAAHDDAETFAACDLEFHLALAAAAKNDVLAARLANLHDHVEEMIALFTETAFRERRVAALVDAHQRLTDAVRRQDVDEAPQILTGMMALLRAEAWAVAPEDIHPSKAGLVAVHSKGAGA